MKRYIFPIAISLLMSLGLVSCYSDDSSLGDPSKVGNIEIAEIEPQSVVSFAGNSIKISPEIKSSYDESDLEYYWYLYKERVDLENGFRTNCISRDRDLSYEVNLASGTYTVALEVKSKSTGMIELAQTSVNVSTEFSDGFYILKETADGNTELDMSSEASFLENIITKVSGAPISGTPVNMSMVYGQNCVDPDSYDKIATNTINVFTDNDYRSYRTEDMKMIFDRKSISYAGEDNEEQYCTLVNGYAYAFLISKNGSSGVTFGDEWGASTGKYGLPSAKGSLTKFVQMMGQGYTGMAVWDNGVHGIVSIDYSSSYTSPISSDASGQEECLASGINKIGGIETVWFVSESKVSGTRFLYLIDSASGELTEKKELPQSLHISKASVIAACGGSAAYIYAIDGGKLYGYGWKNDTEVEISLPGVSGDINFVTNQWHCDPYGRGQANYDYDNLIVGSQNGNGYTLYFFDDLVGGIPSQKAYRVISGTGKVKSIRRATPAKIGSNNTYFSMMGTMPIFPISD